MSTSQSHKRYHEKNKDSWNEATKAHNRHKGDQAALLKDGWSPLFEEELNLLGDLKGLDLLHLQCNSGQDSLSLARLGANVTGVDISEEAITFARQLSKDSGIPANFELSDILEWMPKQSQQQSSNSTVKKYDRIFSSYGTIIWLGDLDAWAAGIAQLLKPNTGRLVLIDFHPFSLYFDEEWKPTYSYFDKGPVENDGVGDYVADSGDALIGVKRDVSVPAPEKFVNPHKSYEYFYGIGDIVTSLVKAGLSIEHLQEYPYSNGWKGFKDMVDIGNRRFEPPSYIPKLPLMYSVSASLKK